MPTRSEPTTTAPLSSAPGLTSFRLSPSDTNTRTAGVSPAYTRLRRGKPAYAEATVGRQNGTRLGPLDHPSRRCGINNSPTQTPGPPEHIFHNPWKKSMSELTQGTEKNLGAALFIALQLITLTHRHVYLMLLREFLTKKSGSVPYAKTLVCALHVVQGQTHSALSI
jgi:hypothetical protein